MSLAVRNEEAAELATLSGRIQQGLQRSALDIIEVGKALLRAKEIVGHGRFGAWLDREFRLSPRSAQRFMAAAARFGDRPDTVSHLPAGLVHELASPSVPDDVVERVLRGEIEQVPKTIRAETQSYRQTVFWGRASKRVIADMWHLPDEVEAASKALAKALRKADPQYVRWCGSVFARAAELIENRGG